MLESSGNKQELPRYWSNTSPASPIYILHTAPHAAIALLGACGVACLCWALIQQVAFDASLAAVFVLLCVYIYSLLSERCRQEHEWQEFSGQCGTGKTDAKHASAADGMSELDLTGYAKTLGVSLRSGVVHKEGSTLNKIMMDALAKEYLRCVSALRCYQEAFGPLPAEPHEQQQQQQEQERQEQHFGETFSNKEFAAAARASTDPDPSPSGFINPPLVPAIDFTSLSQDFAAVSKALAGSGTSAPSTEPEASSEAAVPTVTQQPSQASSTIDSTTSTSGPSHQEASSVEHSRQHVTFGLFGR